MITINRFLGVVTISQKIKQGTTFRGLNNYGNLRGYKKELKSWGLGAIGWGLGVGLARRIAAGQGRGQGLRGNRIRNRGLPRRAYAQNTPMAWDAIPLSHGTLRQWKSPDFH